jgi:hypothetical protein
LIDSLKFFVPWICISPILIFVRNCDREGGRKEKMEGEGEGKERKEEGEEGGRREQRYTILHQSPFAP